MIELQIIAKVINSSDYSFIEDNLITEDDFIGSGYEDEFAYIHQHYKQYGNVPDKATFLSKFPEYVKDGKDRLPVVTESDKYLIDTFREEQLFKKCVPIIEHAAQLTNADANAGVEYLLNALKNLQPHYQLNGVDLISNVVQRFEQYKDKVENHDKYYVTTGFPELDTIFRGIQLFEELIVLFARPGQGKSWVLLKMLSHIWKLGFNIAYISPEMSADSIGYRFDTVNLGYSNSSLMYGLSDIDVEEYEKDLQKLKESKNKFIVSTPVDFDNRITVSKLRNFIKQHHIEVLGIDGVKYMTDERYRKGDKETTSLTHISEDLMSLSVELKIPIIVVSQANRLGERDEIPDIDNISSSDGIGQCATKVIGLRQDNGYLEMQVQKNRYGNLGTKLKYLWDINTGKFTYTPNYDDQSAEERTERIRKKKVDKDVF